MKRNLDNIILNKFVYSTSCFRGVAIVTLEDNVKDLIIMPESVPKFFDWDHKELVIYRCIIQSNLVKEVIRSGCDKFKLKMEI